MPSLRHKIIKLIEQQSIPSEKIGDALIIAKVVPDGKAWRTFIDRLLLWLGSLALTFAVMFFIAYNWDDLGKFTKFAMVEALIVLAIVAYSKFGEYTLIGKVSLLVAAILVGVLLALYGQTYQTGADPWQLFFNWALLILPWAIIGRFPAIWVVWVALINLSIVLYHQAFPGAFGLMFGSGTGMLWMTFLFNTLALVVWELLAKTWSWLSQRWSLRLIAVGSGFPITWLVLYEIFERYDVNLVSPMVWILWIAAMVFVYRSKIRDLFMLAGCCLSGIVVVIAFLTERFLDNEPVYAFLFLALLVVGLGTGSAFWLKKIHSEWQQ